MPPSMFSPSRSSVWPSIDPRTSTGAQAKARSCLSHQSLRTLSNPILSRLPLSMRPTAHLLERRSSSSSSVFAMGLPRNWCLLLLRTRPTRFSSTGRIVLHPCSLATILSSSLLVGPFSFFMTRGLTNLIVVHRWVRDHVYTPSFPGSFAVGIFLSRLA